MRSINKFSISGRLTKDPELKELEDGNKVVNVSLAVDRNYKDKDGKEMTDFPSFALWNKQAENICAISKKGSLIYLEGHLITKPIETEKGKIYTLQPVIETYQHLSYANEKGTDNTNEKETKKEKGKEK